MNLSSKGFITLVYEEVLELLPNDNNRCISHKEFVEKYDLCHVGFSPKQIKMLRYCTKEELLSLFGPIVNKKWALIYGMCKS